MPYIVLLVMIAQLAVGILAILMTKKSCSSRSRGGTNTWTASISITSEVKQSD